ERRTLAPTPHRNAGEQAQEDAIDQIAGQNVGPQTDGERKNTSAGTDDFHGEKQEGQDPIADGVGRPSESSKVFEHTVMTEAVTVEIRDGDAGAARRNRGVAGGRKKRRKDAKKICQQKENRNRSNNVDVLQRVVMHVLNKQVADAKSQGIGDKHFGTLLRG